MSLLSFCRGCALRFAGRGSNLAGAAETSVDLRLPGLPWSHQRSLPSASRASLGELWRKAQPRFETGGSGKLIALFDSLGLELC